MTGWQRLTCELPRIGTDLLQLEQLALAGLWLYGPMLALDFLKL